MKGIGLVFSGGGGKGAYEIGVWKYMHEQGLDRYVKAVSGTSVGALNAALFVGSSFERAEKIWESIRPEFILTPKDIKIEDIIWLLFQERPSTNILQRISSAVFSKKATIEEKIAQMLVKSVYGGMKYGRTESGRNSRWKDL